MQEECSNVQVCVSHHHYGLLRTQPERGTAHLEACFDLRMQDATLTACDLESYLSAKQRICWSSEDISLDSSSPLSARSSHSLELE